MTTTNANNPNFNMPWQRQNTNPNSTPARWVDSSLNEIEALYFTNDTEKERTTFKGTFTEYNTNISDHEASAGATEGYQFYKALIDCKENNVSKDGKPRTGLMERLNISSEEYDAFACIALAIGSQETGLGYEIEYTNENTTLEDVNDLRDVGDLVHTYGRKFGKAFIAMPVIRNIAGLFGVKDDSASSGITQLKIYDQMQEMSEWEKGILKEYGIETSKLLGKGFDNLASDPEKSAVATMVVLKRIKDNYSENINGDNVDSYKGTMTKAFNELQEEYIAKGESPQEALEKGFDSLANIYNYYQSINDEDKKLEIRTAIKDAFIAYDDSTLEERQDSQGNRIKDIELVEEYQIQKLQEALGGNVSFSAEDLNYIRFAMCSEDAQMDVAEYCAYAWNKGTGESGMKPDRLISEKLGIIFSDPEIFDYNQYTANVVTIASHYANQITEDENGYFLINDNLKE
ncbi:MAG: hypothetical protein E7Z88_07050 [Cyanobacteria bacterium SIG27]|nr:hypothetical protein [Cyanobacteria bacterium SIG27]